MPKLALTAVGRDRSGIVAGLASVLVEHRTNIEDSQATILRGHFSMVLILDAPPDLDEERLSADLEHVGDELGLEAVVLREVEELEAALPEPSHTVTVYGVDHPGIVRGAARALNGVGANITDLNTRLVEQEADSPLYVLMMEVALPEGASAEAVRSALDELGRREGVEVTIRELEQDVL